MASDDVREQRPGRLSKKRWITIAACAGVAIVFAIAVNRHALIRFAVRSAGLNLDLGYTLHFVVPTGYRGVFSISEDPMNGVSAGSGGHGEFIYSIPDSGHLVTTDITPMMTWHKTEATYRSGTVIRVEGSPTEIKCRDLAVISPAPSRKLILKYLIGNDQEASDWWSNRTDWLRIEKPDENERRE